MVAVARLAAPALGDLTLADLVDEWLVALDVGGRSRRTIDW